MGSPNGGIIGVINPTSFGKCTQTIATASTTLTTQPGTRSVAVAVVAGGGGSAGGSGGGGAGGLRTCASFSVCGATAYPITIGAGGASNASGSNSVFSTITSNGGGKGGTWSTCVSAYTGTAGGSGGGSSAPSPGTPGSAIAGGAGNTPPVSPPQGNPGGAGQHVPGVWAAGGGGGGASVAGSDASQPVPGNIGVGGAGGLGAATAVNNPGGAGRISYVSIQPTSSISLNIICQSGAAGPTGRTGGTVTTTTQAGLLSLGNFDSTVGQNSSASANLTPFSSIILSAGADGASANAGNGYSINATAISPLLSGGTSTSINGQSGITSQKPFYTLGGAGGFGASSGNGGNGGNGSYGCGGGGGGAGTLTGGNGGRGGDGIVLITTSF